MLVNILKHHNYFDFFCCMPRAGVPLLVHGKGRAPKLDNTCRRQLSSKDHDHGSYEEEAEGEEGSEEVVALSSTFESGWTKVRPLSHLEAGARPELLNGVSDTCWV
jgi:hypothetical protein